jgi:sterol desaturase/sphingolipid hydroxylase (fatty acid hydroxylase superfamily)
MEKYIHLFFQAFQDYAGYLASEVVTLRWNNYLYWLIGISLFFLLLEHVAPWRKNQKALRPDFWLDGFYMFFNFFLFSLVGYYAISTIFVEAFNSFLGSAFGVTNLVAIEIASWPVWAQLLTLFVLRDFLHWNIHRLLHRVPWLWEFHKVHHSVRQMGFASHLRFHPMETVVYRTLEYLPLGMIGYGIQEFFLVHLLALSIGHFNHANIYVPLGPLKYILNNPQLHAYHHARNLPGGHRFGVNYGISLSLWDYLFGTAYLDSQSREAALGFAGDENFPSTFLDQVRYGFRKPVLEQGPRLSDSSLEKEEKFYPPKTDSSAAEPALPEGR